MMLAELTPATLLGNSEDVLVNVFRPQPGSDEFVSEIEKDVDCASWEIFSCWKEQLNDQFGGGTPTPLIPTSQRQYDGENPFEFCEVWLG